MRMRRALRRRRRRMKMRSRAAHALGPGLPAPGCADAAEGQQHAAAPGRWSRTPRSARQGAHRCARVRGLRSPRERVPGVQGHWGAEALGRHAGACTSTPSLVPAAWDRGFSIEATAMQEPALASRTGWVAAHACLRARHDAAMRLATRDKWPQTDTATRWVCVGLPSCSPSEI